MGFGVHPVLPDDQEACDLTLLLNPRVSGIRNDLEPAHLRMLLDVFSFEAHSQPRSLPDPSNATSPVNLIVTLRVGISDET
jgi:hypothetical protein